ncbi:MAG: aldehyde dehydrogenase [Chitinophagaceae bacterium]|nr:aldehyde dehydrogenase [Chitinophagaceae bacterium]MCW5906149.1 aldehyde dehydrogenase [Chitinophagaceae bacterium]
MQYKTMTNNLTNIKQYFETGATKSYQFRKQQLQKLAAAISKYEKDISEALQKDLGKSEAESYATEIAMVQMEINFMLKHLKKLMKPTTVSTNMLNIPSSSKIYYDALGVVLIIAPWNYPFQLAFTPLIGATAGGNCAVIKPSEYTPATSMVIEKIVKEIFDEQYIFVVQGNGAEVVPALINNFRFNHIFFTGSITVGKAVYEMAAKQLIPVTLELGGKSPCVVEDDAAITVAAKRIAMGKFLNVGQTCIAPDYLLIHEAVKEKFVTALINTIEKFYTKNAALSEDYGKIVSEKRFDVLQKFLNDGEIIYGGNTDKSKLYIQPTIMQHVPLDAALMTEEIFGPILPIYTFNTQEEALKIINRNPYPLAFYIFTNSTTKEAKWIDAVSFGGGCVNNTTYHFSNHHFPFGGIGFSGIGAYHGKKSFYTFTHAKPVLKTATWFDPSIKYPPFRGKLKWMKMFLK